MDPNDTVAKIVFAGMRFMLAGLILLVGILLVNRKSLLVTRRQVPVLIIFGVVQTALQYFFFYNGLAKTSGMQGAILVSSGTFFTVLLAHFFYSNDRMNWQKAIGLIAGFGGIIVANWGQEFQLSFQLTGDGYMILAALTGAIATIMLNEMESGTHPFELTSWQFNIVSVLILVICLPQMN